MLKSQPQKLQTVFLKYSLLMFKFVIIFPWCALILNKALPNSSFVLLKLMSRVSNLELRNENLFLKHG